MFAVGRAALRIAGAERWRNLRDGELEAERREDLRPGFIGPVVWPEK